MVWLSDVEKNEDIFVRFGTLHERDRHRERERETDRHTPHDGIGRAYA